LATKSEQDMKLLQQEISQLQAEFRTQTKRAKESQQPRVRSPTFSRKFDNENERKRLKYLLFFTV